MHSSQRCVASVPAWRYPLLRLPLPRRRSTERSPSPTRAPIPAGTACEFPVHLSQVERGDVRAFSDRDGNFFKAIVQIDYDATITANGRTLVERDTFNRTIYADDTMRDAGLTVHIQGPGGIVMRDAGQII